MKTRAQIYSHEASGILRDIFTYGVLHRNRFWVYIHRRMSNVLCAMNTMDLQRYPENYELLSTDAALRAEQIACRMRHLVYGFTTVQKHEDLTSAANVLGITITAHPGQVEYHAAGSASCLSRWPRFSMRAAISRSSSIPQLTECPCFQA